MAPSDESSNIRVFVKWHEQTVFSGEEIKCTITFKNVAQNPDQPKQAQQPSQSDRHRLASSLHSRAKASIGSSAAAGRGGHKRSALSLSVTPSSATHNRTGSLQWPSTGSAAESRPNHAHQRSISIVSIGSTSTVDDHVPRNNDLVFPQRPARGHNRASSLQIVPRAQPSLSFAPSSSPFLPRHNNSPTFNASYPPNSFRGPRNAQSPLNGPRSSNGFKKSPRGSPNSMPEFSFPAAPPSGSDPSRPAQSPTDGSLLSPRTMGPDSTNLPLRHREHGSSMSDGRPAPAARILSSTSMMSGTPRSSGEFYPASNHSSETLASEYLAQPTRPSSNRPLHLRRSSGLSPQKPRSPESLMMGYAQIQGSFTLDGSLVSLGSFEQVKKKAATGGRGGGVIGLEPTKRESGLLRGFGWGNISSSIGDLLGGGELSTIKEMRTVANSKSIPLLSTPQSILFVDLQLAPGQTRTFEYTFKLPKGLPPTHKGKAVKISYSLVLGTQRAGGAREQQVRTVETPFRVLGSVNSIGEILGHDLMNPYILLRDEAQVKTFGRGNKAHKNKAPSRAPATLNEFLSYAEELIAHPRDELNGTLLSPTAVSGSRRPSALEESTSSKEAIHLAIMRSNMTTDGQQSPNRFEIARNGLRVGVVMLTRPAYRLGEVVTMAVDLTDADIPCYAIHAFLETAEKVDPSLAIRSESSIHRVTRKVYVTTSEVTLFSRRVIFTPTIPISATPEFITSGVNFEWKIRVEFVVPASKQTEPVDSPDPQPPSHPLLEQISQDERGGLVLAAAENLACESFDIAVPLRVYGAVGSGLERLDRDEASDEGLPI